MQKLSTSDDIFVTDSDSIEGDRVEMNDIFPKDASRRSAKFQIEYGR